MVTWCPRAKSYRSKNMGLCLWIICKLHLYDMVDRRDHTELPMSGKLWVEPPQSWKRLVVWDCKMIGISPEIHLLPIGLESVQGFLFVPSRLKSETKQTSFKKLQDTLDLWSNCHVLGWGFKSCRCQKYFSIQIDKNLFAEVRAKEKGTLSLIASVRVVAEETRREWGRSHYLKHQSYLPCKRC